MSGYLVQDGQLAKIIKHVRARRLPTRTWLLSIGKLDVHQSIKLIGTKFA